MNPIILGLCFIVLVQIECGGARYTSEELTENRKSSFTDTRTIQKTEEENRRHHLHQYHHMPPYVWPQQRYSNPYPPSYPNARSQDNRYPPNEDTRTNLIDLRSGGFQDTYSNDLDRRNANIMPRDSEIYQQPAQNSWERREPIQPVNYPPQRAYSIYTHSLKTNSEYNENGQHVGPFQGHNNHLGYGSPSGGYNGAFNRPGF